MYTHLYPHIRIYRLKTTSSHQYLPFQPNTIGFISVPTPLAYLYLPPLSVRILSPIGFCCQFLCSIALCNQFSNSQRASRNTSWNHQPLLAVLSTHQHPPCGPAVAPLPSLQFTFHLLPSSSGKLFLPILELIKHSNRGAFISVYSILFLTDNHSRMSCCVLFLPHSRDLVLKYIYLKISIYTYERAFASCS